MSRLVQIELLEKPINKSDCVYTPTWAAKDMIEFFKPTGRILEPCKGSGSILQFLPGADWCEIVDGKDFFKWNAQVDWIISNPPYSQFNEWLQHSFDICENVVYLIPLQKIFNAYGVIKICRNRGWMKHIRFYGGGSRLRFPMGNAIGAVHFIRGYSGETSWSFYWPE